MKRECSSRIKVKSFDQIFNGEQHAADKQITNIPLELLHPFKNHPFRVVDDERMEETVNSIKEYGVLMPGIVRQRREGGYEIISGHRRVHASKRAGLKTVPMIIQNLDDDDAVCIMVDSNLQREDLLPSEKAKSYRMRNDHEKHSGVKGKNTYQSIGEASGESPKTVQRYIALSYLLPELLQMVDDRKLGFRQGVDIAALSPKEQTWVIIYIKNTPVQISMNQSEKLKEFSKSKELTEAMVRLILREEPKKKRKVTINDKRLQEYFSEDTDVVQIEEIIFGLLEEWKMKGGEH